MRTLQQYPKPETLVSWILWHLSHNRDVAIEFRAPKGFGKSVLMLHLLLKLVEAWHRQRNQPVPSYLFERSLCYSHKQFVNVVKHLRRIRQHEDRLGVERSLQFLWADDATRIINRRAHMTKKNRAVLDLTRTMRDAILSVQFYGTQDDLVERPLMDGGVYLLILFQKPYEPWICWPKTDPMMKEETRWIPMFPMKLGFNPTTVYAQEMARYTPARRKLTDELMKESLRTIGGERQRLGAPPWKLAPNKRGQVFKLRAKGWTQQQIAEKLNVSQPYVSHLLRNNMGHKDSEGGIPA